MQLYAYSSFHIQNCELEKELDTLQKDIGQYFHNTSHHALRLFIGCVVMTTMSCILNGLTSYYFI